MNSAQVILENPLDNIIDISALAKFEFLHDILPYDPSNKINKELLDGLKEYQLLLRALSEASQHYIHGRLNKFDSLVGENACQIRAVKIALLATNDLNVFFDLDEQIQNSIKTIESLLEQKKIASLMLSGISLYDLLKNENLFISLTDDEAFLLQSFLLSEAKEVIIEEEIMTSLCRKEVANHAKLKKFGQVSTSFMKKLVKHLRQFLSKASVHFVRELANQSENELLKNMVSDQFTAHHFNNLCVPMFWTNKILLNTIYEKKLPIIVHVKFLKDNSNGEYSIFDEAYLHYGADQKNYDKPQVLEPIDNQFDINVPAIIVQGVAVISTSSLETMNEWERAIRSLSIRDIILAAGADHRQYPNPQMELYLEPYKDDDFCKFKAIAQHQGFSITNPSTLFINHVYTVVPKNHLFC